MLYQGVEATDAADQRSRLTREQRRRGHRHDQDAGVVGNRAGAGELDALDPIAAALELGAEAPEVMVGAPEEIALAVAEEIDDPALALLRQAQLTRPRRPRFQQKQRRSSFQRSQSRCGKRGSTRRRLKSWF